MLHTIDGMDHHLGAAGSPQAAYDLRVKNHREAPHEKRLSMEVSSWIGAQTRCGWHVDDSLPAYNFINISLVVLETKALIGTTAQRSLSGSAARPSRCAPRAFRCQRDECLWRRAKPAEFD
jgi:hypothetical protein